MSEVQCLKIRIQDGATDRVVEFLEELRSRDDEVQASLAREGIRAEARPLELLAHLERRKDPGS